MVWKFSSASSRPWLISGWYGRVGGVPGRVLQDVAAHHRRGQRVVVALPDHRHRDGVARRPARAARPAPRPRWPAGGSCRGRARRRRRSAVEDAGGQRLVGELVERADADDVLSMVATASASRSDVPVGELGWSSSRARMRHRSRRLRGQAQDRCGSSPSVVDPYRAPERFGAATCADAFPHRRVSRALTAFQRHRGPRGPGCLRG